MKLADYLRERAAELRAMAAQANSAETRRELEALAERCEQLAKGMGNGASEPRSP